MNVFLTGATGYIGSAVAEALLAGGHSVTGLARSPEAAEKLRLRGITPHAGDLHSPAALRDTAKSSDGIIHAGTTNNGDADKAAVETMLDALRGSGQAFVYTSGIWVLGDTGGRLADEDAPLHPAALVAWRPAVERLVLDAAFSAVRAIVIRPAIVYGRGGGIPADFLKSARENGEALYVGTGENHWPLVHAADLADLYARAFENAAAGTLLHAADDSAHRVKDIAEAASFGAGAGWKTRSWPLEEARKELGAYADALTLDQRISAERAKNLLGWRPRALDILEALRLGRYEE